MARFNVPITQLVNNDASSVAVGWKLNFYSTGTTTRKDTFSDVLLTTANTNPVIADSAGRFGDIFLESGTYKVTLTDASDLEIWSAENVDGAVGSSGAVETKTIDYSISVDDSTKVIQGDASSGAITITLLAAATAGDGFEITVKKSDSSVNAVTVDGNGSETIDGAATVSLTQQYRSVTLRCDGSNWHTVSTAFDGDDVIFDRSFSLARNLALAASVASSALTISLKGWDGTDPSAINPVVVPFRNSTLATGTASLLTVTSATSLVVSSGSTLGASSGEAFRLWIVAFNDGGTFRLGVVNPASATNTLALRSDALQSSTAEGGAGGADSALIIYAGATVSSKPMQIIGYMDWDSGLSTAGTWDAVPDQIQLFDPTISLPSESFAKSFTSTQQTITAAGSLTLAHGLGATPTLLQARLICTDASGEAGYAQNDEVVVPLGATDSGGNIGAVVVPDATNLNVRFGSSAASFVALNKTTGAIANLTNSKWTIVFRAWV